MKLGFIDISNFDYVLRKCVKETEQIHIAAEEERTNWQLTVLGLYWAS